MRNRAAIRFLIKKTEKRGLTKGGVSGNIHGRLERGGRRERLRAKGKKFRKKFLTKRNAYDKINELSQMNKAK